MLYRAGHDKGAGSSIASSSRGRSYFAAAVALSMTAWQSGCREGVVDSLVKDEHYTDMDIAVALEGLSKVWQCFELFRLHICVVEMKSPPPPPLGVPALQWGVRGGVQNILKS